MGGSGCWHHANPAGKEVGDTLRQILHRRMDAAQVDWEAALDSIGLEGAQVPEESVAEASGVRGEIAKVFRVQHLESDGLQSGLIQTLLRVMQDPDLVAAKWLKDKAMPLGNDVPIVPGNVFMLTTEHSAKGALTSIGSMSPAKLPVEVKHPLNTLCKESLKVESSSAPKLVYLRVKPVDKSSTTKGDEA